MWEKSKLGHFSQVHLLYFNNSLSRQFGIELPESYPISKFMQRPASISKEKSGTEL
jgi:hypothetical protein